MRLVISAPRGGICAHRGTQCRGRAWRCAKGEWWGERLRSDRIPARRSAGAHPRAGGRPRPGEHVPRAGPRRAGGCRLPLDPGAARARRRRPGFAEASVLQQRLAGAAPATALAINMHLVWTGVAKVLADRGIHDLRFVQEGAAAGEVFAFGISEAGNDWCSSAATRMPRPSPTAPTRSRERRSSPLSLRSGRSSDSTVWIPPRRMRPRWSTHSSRDRMRPTVAWSCATTGTRSGCAAPSRERPSCTARSPRPIESCAASTRDPIPIRSCSASSAPSRCCSHRCTRASRAGRWTWPSRPRKAPVEEVGRGLQPGPRHPLADRRHGDRIRRAAAAAPEICRDIDDRVDHGRRWFSLLAGVKHRAVSMAKSVVDDAILVSGGSSYFSGSELSRLYRDVIAGMFHPSDPESAHTTVATAWLGPLESHRD